MLRFRRLCHAALCSILVMGCLPAPAAPPPSPPPPATTPRFVPRVALSRIDNGVPLLPDQRTRDQITVLRRRQVIGLFYLCLTEEGTVATVTMLKSTGFQAYDARLTAGVSHWRYRPFVVDGKPAPVCTEDSYTYGQ